MVACSCGCEAVLGSISIITCTSFSKYLLEKSNSTVRLHIRFHISPKHDAKREKPDSLHPLWSLFDKTSKLANWFRFLQTAGLHASDLK